MSELKVNKLTGITGTSAGAPITLSGDTATLGTGSTIGSGVTGTLGSGITFPAGHVVQTVVDNDDTTFSNTSVSGNVGNEVALSKAYSVTPSGTSNKILVQYAIPQVSMKSNVGGLFMRIYRKIGAGSYAHLTEASGDGTGTPNAAYAGNYDNQGDGNRSSWWMGGHFTDRTHGQNGVELSYKFYFGVGDSGTHSIQVNRSTNDNNATYNFRTKTHVVLQEIKG